MGDCLVKNTELKNDPFESIQEIYTFNGVLSHGLQFCSHSQFLIF